MRSYILLFIYGALPLWLFSQTPGSAREITCRVADGIIKNTSFLFKDTQTGASYSSLNTVSIDNPLQAESPYNKWEYWNGVMLNGMLQLNESIQQKKYSDYVFKWVDFVFSNVSFFKQRYDQGKKTEWLYFFRMSKLDDCGALASALVNVNSIVNKSDYGAYLQKTGNYILKKQYRFPDSTLCRKEPREMTLWADDLYMSVPFLARMGRTTGNKIYFEDAIRQVLNFNHYLYDNASGLYFHCYYNDVNNNGVAHWARCNGWLALAQVELLNNLPVNHPFREKLIGLLLRQIIGFSRYQDTSGLWRQLLDKEDSYLETSATAMFVYAVARAVNQKWIAPSYLQIAIDGWKGLCSKITEDGQLQDVCIGTGIQDNIRFYYNRPKKLNDLHGLGPFLLAGSEMIKVEEQHKQ
ncbi:MAG: glycoside hydrolase family 88 protein [Niabella sp.]